MSGEVLLQSTGVDVTFSAYLSSDHVTPATGKTIAITISKNKGAFGNPSAGATNATEIASGVYYVNLSTTDTGTLGPLVLLGTSATIDNVVVHYRVRTATAMDMTNLDAAITSRMATYTQPTGFLAAAFPGTVASTTNITAGTITTATNLTNAPTAGDFTATMKTSIGTAVAASAVASVTGNVGGNVTGSVGSVVGAVGSVTGLTASNLDATVSSRLASASYTAPPSAVQNATAVLTTQMTESYRANGTAPTLAQAQFETIGHLGESAISGTTKTVNKVDHSTAAETFTLDSATAPSSITRAT